MRPLLAGTNTKGYSQGIIFVVTGAILLLALTIDAVARLCRQSPPLSRATTLAQTTEAEIGVAWHTLCVPRFAQPVFRYYA